MVMTETSNTQERPDRRTVNRWRRRRKKWLRPIAEMRFVDAFYYIDSAKKRELEAILFAMNTVTTTNCWWVEYEITCLLRPRIQSRLQMLSEKITPRSSAKSS